MIVVLRRFLTRWGWRAYALPVLAVVTIAVFVDPQAIGSTNGAPPPAHLSAPVLNPTTSPAPPPRQPAEQVALRADTTPCAKSKAAHLVLVSIRAQRAWMCRRRTQVYSTLVTTGAVNVGNGTPLGTWHVQAKQRNRYLVGPGYRDFVKYWMPFDGDYGFHDASWQKMPYGSAGYRKNGSHGCIHLPLHAMRWLYRWANAGTTVTIHT